MSTEQHRPTEDRMEATLNRIEARLVELIQTGAKHEQLLEDVKRRLDILNGTVAKHEQRIQNLERQAVVGAAVAQAKRGLLTALRPLAAKLLVGLGWLLAAMVIFHLPQFGQALERFLGLHK